MPVHDFDRIINRRGGDCIKWNLYPEDVLPMWVADSDFTAPEPLVRALRERMDHGIYGYCDPQANEFRQAVCHWMDSRFGWRAKEEWVAFSPSVVFSLAVCVTTFTEPGESVLFLTPSYPPFFQVCENNGRKALTSSLIFQNGRYEIDFDDLEQKLARQRTRMFFLCNPHNPTGRVFSREELLRIGQLCEKHNVLVIADEIHCDYVFPGNKHIPFAGLSEELARRTLTTINPSKTFNVADLHASAVISANQSLLGRFSRAVSNLGLHGNAIGLLALRVAYTECHWYADQVAAYVKANIDHAVAHINSRLTSISASAPEATYLLWLDCRQMSLPQNELPRFFLDRAKIALNSGTDYGPEGEGFMRMNLACPRATLTEALNRLEKAAREKVLR